ncbi:citrate lyase subunit beta-like protein, mitochondrial [Arapaima gigas]
MYGKRRVGRSEGPSARVPARCRAALYSQHTVRPAPRYVPRRAVLYVPGNDERKLRKLATLDVDCAVLDCEDGVAVSQKAAARETIARMLPELDLGRTEKCVRVNSVSSGLADADLEVLLRGEVLPAALMLPKVEDVSEVRWFADRFGRHVSGRSLEEPVRLVTFVETATGLLNFKAVCEEVRRRGPAVGLLHDAVVFGSDDFCASIGATRTRDARELLYARQKVVVTTKAFGLQAIDLVYIDYQDVEGLRRQAQEGALMGFTGTASCRHTHTHTHARTQTPARPSDCGSQHHRLFPAVAQSPAAAIRSCLSPHVCGTIIKDPVVFGLKNRLCTYYFSISMLEKT